MGGSLFRPTPRVYRGLYCVGWQVPWPQGTSGRGECSLRFWMGKMGGGLKLEGG